MANSLGYKISDVEEPTKSFSDAIFDFIGRIGEIVKAFVTKYEEVISCLLLQPHMK